MLEGEHLPGPAEAGLHLVDDHHDAVLVADPADSCEELRRRDDESPFPLDGLDHDRRDRLRRDGRDQRALERGERLARRGASVVLRERQPVDLGRERAETGLVRVGLRRE